MELDGWEYHASSIADDLEARLLMIRSGKVDVVTLTWPDLDETDSLPPPNPVSREALGAALVEILGRLWSEPVFSFSQPAHRELELIIANETSKGSIGSLIARLEGESAGSLAPALLSYIVANRSGKTLEDMDDIGSLDEESRIFLSEAASHNRFAQDRLTVYFGSPGGDPHVPVESPEKFRIVLHADFHETADADEFEDRATVGAWRGMWRLVNLLQALPGFHVQFPGLRDLGTPRPDSPFERDRAAWQELAELLDGRALRILEALEEAKAPMPDGVGVDLMEAGSVVGQAELCRLDAQVGFSYNRFSHKDWRIRQIDDADDGDVSEDVSWWVEQCAARGIDSQ